MKRVAAIAVIVDLVFLAVAFFTSIKDFLFGHQWLLRAMAAAPALVIAFLEYQHSGEANKLRREANGYREQAVEQNREANRFREEANEQRERANQALAQIATHTKKAPTKVERTAERLQKYIGQKPESSMPTTVSGAMRPKSWRSPTRS